MNATVENITPMKAIEYLRTSKGNPRYAGNRMVNERVVKSMVQDIKAGNWVLNGEPIVFDENGILVDGHHRLMAVVDSNTPTAFLVVRGAERTKDGYALYDAGRNRTTAQTYGGAEFINQRTIAAARLQRMIDANSTSAPMTNSEVYAWCQRNAEVLSAAHSCIHRVAQNGKCINYNGIFLLAYTHAISSGVHIYTIDRFDTVFTKGFPDGVCENAALVTRNVIEALERTTHNATSPGARLEKVRAIERGIQLFIEENPSEKRFKVPQKYVYGDKLFGSTLELADASAR